MPGTARPTPQNPTLQAKAGPSSGFPGRVHFVPDDVDEQEAAPSPAGVVPRGSNTGR